MMKKCIKLTILIILNLLQFGHFELINAQGNIQEEFDDFVTTIESEFYIFQDSIDNTFAQYLEQAWQEFIVYEGIEPPQYGNAFVSPYNEKLIKDPSYDTSVKPSFFGQEIIILPTHHPDLYLANVSEKEVANAWRSLSNYNFNSLLSNFIRYSKLLHLNDWGCYSLLDYIVNKEYSSFSSKEKTLLLFYLLTHSGYKVKIARNEQTSLILLLPFKEKIYKCPFTKIDGIKYYLWSRNTTKPERIYSFSNNYSEKHSSLSLAISTPPTFPDRFTLRDFSDNKKYPFTIELNNNVIEFYDTWPLCDLSVYFEAMPSNTFIVTLDNIIKRHLVGKNTFEQISFLLDFVQQSFNHKADSLVHGYEKYYFPEEVFFYPYADCEDLAVLLSWLIRHFTTQNVIILYYKNHVALAVEYMVGYEGDSFKWQGKQYVFCDPSYKGAPLGNIIPECTSLMPKIVSYYK